MKNIKKTTKTELKRSWPWTTMVCVLFMLFFLTRPVGQSVLEAVGLQDTNWEDMIETIEVSVGSYPGEVGIYIKDLKTGQVYERNSDDRFLSASLIKLPIMAADWHIEPASDSTEDQRIAEWLERQLFEGMTYSWEWLLRHILLHLDLGTMPF